jgi:hypothetical protein
MDLWSKKSTSPTGPEFNPNKLFPQMSQMSTDADNAGQRSDRQPPVENPVLSYPICVPSASSADNNSIPAIAAQ